MPSNRSSISGRDGLSLLDRPCLEERVVIEAAKMAQTRDATVLLADSVYPSRTRMSDLLSQCGYTNIVTAEDGEQALKKIKNIKDLYFIIADWRLPKIDGAKLLRRVRLDPRYKRLPFIILSSRADSESIALAVDLDATHYLVKPVTYEALKRKLDRLDGEGPQSDLRDALSRMEKFLKSERYEEAEEAIRGVADRYPSMLPRVEYELAKMALAQEDVRTALAHLDSTLATTPKMARAWVLRSEVLARLGRMIEAEESLDRALAISPDNPSHLIAQGRLHLQNARSDQAKWSFMRALNISGKDDLILLELFNTYVEHGYTDIALKEFGPYLLAHLSLQSLNNMGVTLRRQGKVKEAIDVYRRSLLRFPNSSELNYNIALAYLRNDKDDLAVSALERAVRLKPDFQKAAQLLKEIKR